jgi:hypothetical protein
LIRFGKQFATCDLAISLTVRPARANRQAMHDVASLVETYLAAERNLVAAVESAGGAVPLPDSRTITVGRAEFDALLGQRRKQAWVIIRKQAPMPARR